MPPPPAPAAFSALWIATVSLAMPSPFAPQAASVTTYKLVLAGRRDEMSLATLVQYTVGIAFEMAWRASTSRLLALPKFTSLAAGLNVQPVNAARVAFAAITHWVLPSKVEFATLNTPGPVSCSAFEKVQLWNCIQECQLFPVELTAGP